MASRPRLPELGTVVAALRIRRHETAIAQFFATNFVNLSLIAAADIAYSGGPVIAEPGSFEIVSALLGARRRASSWSGCWSAGTPVSSAWGYDSPIVMLLFAGGLGLLAVTR